MAKKQTLEKLKEEHRKLCDRKIELYKKGSLRGIAGINQNLDALRYKIQEIENTTHFPDTGKMVAELNK